MAENGFPVASIQSPSIGATAGQICGYSPERKGLLISNAGADNVYISPSQGVAVGTGYIIGPGLSKEFSYAEGYKGWIRGPLWAIRAGADANVIVVEMYG